MPSIEIYTQPGCPYCVRAVRLLQQKGAPFTEIRALHGTPERAEARERSGGADNGAADLHQRAAYRWLRRPDGAGTAGRT